MMPTETKKTWTNGEWYNKFFQKADRSWQKAIKSSAAGELTVLCFRIRWTTGVNSSMTIWDLGLSLQCC